MGFFERSPLLIRGGFQLGDVGRFGTFVGFQQFKLYGLILRKGSKSFSLD